MAKHKIVINDSKNLELLLQKIYDESETMSNQIQNEINKITNSVDLANEDSGIDAKTKYSKAINDLLTTKQKAVNTKLDLGKLMAEIIKYNGNIDKAISDSGKTALNFDDLKKKLSEALKNNNPDKPQEYIINN